ncbi:MAG: hypothetical protein QXD61_10440 [Candidatus Caldarchaeum sp.]
MFKKKFWCKDLGFHYHLFIRKSKGNYEFMFTDYHAVHGGRSIVSYEKALEIAWSWIKDHGTHGYIVETDLSYKSDY